MNPSVCYCTQKIRLTKRSDLLREVDDICLSKKDRQFLTDIINGYSYKDLMQKYNISKSRVYQKREKLFESIKRFDIANAQKPVS